MEDHCFEEFVCTKAKVKAFTGKGQMLGRYAIITKFIFL